jgi:hypothetical protein
MAKALVKDHGLLESETREINFNRFMSHIGELWDAKPLGHTNESLTPVVFTGIQFTVTAIPVTKKDDSESKWCDVAGERYR